MPNGDRSHHCSAEAEDQASFVGWRLAKWVSYPKAALSEWHPNLATTCWHQTDLSKTTEHYRTVAALLSSFIHFAAFLEFGAINERFAPVCAACDLRTILKLPLSVLALAEMKVSYLNFACLEHHHCLEIVWSSLLSKTSSLEKSFVLSMQKNCIFGQHIFLMAWLEHGGGRAADDLFHSAFFDKEAHRDFSQKVCCRKSSLLSDASDCLKESWSSSTCICVLFSSASDFYLLHNL